jgi:hypothetical protein
MNPAKSRPWGDTLEEPNVNRPFYAFGALLIALALAMLAVSSTTRSTSVSREAASVPPSSALPAAASSARPDRAARFGLLMVILPAAEGMPLAVADVCCPYEGDGSAYCTGSGPDWHPEIVEVCPLLGGCSAPLAAAPIQPATHDPALLRDETSRDCRSYYDAAYDELVYGQVDGAPSSSQASSSGCNRPATNSYSSREPVAWDEYAELMDGTLDLGSAAGTPAESTSSVRSSRLLLDFAASTLRDAAALLQSAAEALHSAATPNSEVELAGEQPSETR